MPLLRQMAASLRNLRGRMQGLCKSSRVWDAMTHTFLCAMLDQPDPPKCKGAFVCQRHTDDMYTCETRTIVGGLPTHMGNQQ